ncbi:hypothetical protein AAULH_14406, partial [Lactobacillus helveticus MTCC 5463]
LVKEVERTNKNAKNQKPNQLAELAQIREQVNKIANYHKTLEPHILYQKQIYDLS